MHDKQVSIIYYVKDNKAKRQAIRFSKDSWTAAEARGICKREGGTFEAAGPATESEITTLQNELSLLGIKARLAAIRGEPTGKPMDSKPSSISESYLIPVESLREVMGVDDGKPSNIIPNCTFIKSGFNDTGMRFWSPQLLKENLGLYDGALCYIDHANPGEYRSLRALAGRTGNVRWDEGKQAIIGDITVLENEAGNFARSIFSDELVRESNQIGLSPNFDAWNYDLEYRRIGGKTVQYPTRLGPGKPQVDFVATPTGGGRAA